MTWRCVRGVRLCIRKRFFIQGGLCTGAGSQRYGVILGAVLCSIRSWILMIFPNSGYSMILWFYVWNKTMKIRFWMSPMKCTNPVGPCSFYCKKCWTQYLTPCLWLTKASSKNYGILFLSSVAVVTRNVPTQASCFSFCWISQPFENKAWN